MQLGSAVAGVLCADGHLGYGHPIGGVVAYEEDISISGVGFDIACGIMAVRLGARHAEIGPSAQRIMSDVTRHVSFGLGRVSAEKVDHQLFESPQWEAAGVVDRKQRHAISSAGSVRATTISICSSTKGASCAACTPMAIW